jgi:hypothetical protein
MSIASNDVFAAPGALVGGIAAVETGIPSNLFASTLTLGSDGYVSSARVISNIVDTTNIFCPYGQFDTLVNLSSITSVSSLNIESKDDVTIQASTFMTIRSLYGMGLQSEVTLVVNSPFTVLQSTVNISTLVTSSINGTNWPALVSTVIGLNGGPF